MKNTHLQKEVTVSKPEKPGQPNYARRKLGALVLVGAGLAASAGLVELGKSNWSQYDKFQQKQTTEYQKIKDEIEHSKQLGLVTESYYPEDTIANSEVPSTVAPVATLTKP